MKHDEAAQVLMDMLRIGPICPLRLWPGNTLGRLCFSWPILLSDGNRVIQCVTPDLKCKEFSYTMSFRVDQFQECVELPGSQKFMAINGFFRQERDEMIRTIMEIAKL